MKPRAVCESLCGSCKPHPLSQSQSFCLSLLCAGLTDKRHHVPPCPAMGLFWKHALSFADSPPTSPPPHPVPPFACGMHFLNELREQDERALARTSSFLRIFLEHFPGCWTPLVLSMLLPSSFRTSGLMPSLRVFLQLLKTFVSLYSSRNDSFLFLYLYFIFYIFILP